MPSGDYTPAFIGGRLLGSRLYWDKVSPMVGALIPTTVCSSCPDRLPEQPQPHVPAGS